jgi:hypothetical protein
MIYVNQITLGEIWNIVIGAIDVIVLAVTAWIVWMYTKAAQRSNEIQERPILNFYLQGSVFKIKNVGNGPAYNIKFSKLKTTERVYSPYIDEPNPLLEKGGEEKQIKFWCNSHEGQITESYDYQRFLLRLFRTGTEDWTNYKKINRTAAIIVIMYEGINNKKYYSAFRFYSTTIFVPLYADMVVEFIENAEGECNMDCLRIICEKRPIMEHH